MSATRSLTPLQKKALSHLSAKRSRKFPVGTSGKTITALYKRGLIVREREGSREVDTYLLMSLPYSYFRWTLAPPSDNRS